MARPIKKKIEPKQKESPPDKERLESLAAKGIFEEALKGERFSDHPGQADLRIRVFVYQPTRNQEARLPGKQIDLLVSSIEEVNEVRDVIEEGLRLWIQGKWDRESGRFSLSYLN